MLVLIYDIKDIENRYTTGMFQNAGQKRTERSAWVLSIGPDNINECEDINVKVGKSKIYLFYGNMPIGEIIWY